ncbi:MAG: hypothetical protein DMF84_24395 [Acidobacteria bacterium]|nr:MAG: hypothetical protein DMF84_24395 [Acidobacteriota bacterium]
MAPTPMITILTARRLLVSHTAAAPPSRTSVTLASATIHAVLHEDDDAVFALQHCIHLLVNTRRLWFECLP